jgi:hypothetical protein
MSGRASIGALPDGVSPLRGGAGGARWSTAAQDTSQSSMPTSKKWNLLRQGMEAHGA